MKIFANILLVSGGFLATGGGEMSARIALQSSSFRAGQAIPVQYTGEGANKNPQLSIRGIPASAKSWVLICDDPDAPTPDPWVHWVVYNLPTSITVLDEGVDISTISGAHEVVTSFGIPGYGGPMPPKGHGVHRYYFRVYALDIMLDSAKRYSSRAAIDQAMHGHIVAQGELMGTYERF